MPKKVLVVDDEKEIRELLNAVLSADGYSIDSAEGLEPALKFIESNDYDIMLIDKNMPGIGGNSEGGLDLLRRVTSQALPCEVIMMTGHPSIETAIEAMRLGAFDYIRKPFSLADLRLKLGRISKYTNFINSDYVIGVHRRLQGKMCSLIGRMSNISDTEVDKDFWAVNEEIDKLFAIFKESESFILAEREALSHIATLAERLKMNIQETDENYGLVDEICRLSNERL